MKHKAYLVVCVREVFEYGASKGEIECLVDVFSEPDPTGSLSNAQGVLWQEGGETYEEAVRNLKASVMKYWPWMLPHIKRGFQNA